MNEITVNYTGEEKQFTGIMQALRFMRELKEKSIGSDLWVNDELIRSQYKNCLTGKWDIETPVKSFVVTS